MKRIALLGECLIEINGTPFGALNQTFGGDSLNTALYLARLARHTCDVKYVSAVGTDPLSDGMVQRWQAEGIHTELVLRDPSRLPGLYLIQVDERGERSFLYWRGESAARYLLQNPDFDRVEDELANVDLVYLSGISLAILPPADRARLIEILTRLADRSVALVLDSNYRAALWSSADSARAAISALVPFARLLFVTFEDEQQLWGDTTVEASLARLQAAKAQSVVIKLGPAGCICRCGAEQINVAAPPVAAVVDTTSAGDAFNAGFLAGWLASRDPMQSCRAGNALAGAVIQHRGAIIPASATPSLSELLSNTGPAGGP